MTNPDLSPEALLARTITIIVTVAQDGKHRETLCIPVRKLPAFLASINPKKVRAELRPKIELYQAEYA